MELEVSTNANDKQLLEVSLALDQYNVARFLRRNGLHLHEFSGNRAVRTGLVGPMTAKPEFDLSVDLSEFAPDLQVPTSVSK